MAGGIEDIDETVAGPRQVVMLAGLLERIGDKQFATDILNPERREARAADRRRWERRIDKGTGEVNLVEMLVEDVDGPRVEIGGEQKVPLSIAAESQAFVHRTGS